MGVVLLCKMYLGRKGLDLRRDMHRLVAWVLSSRDWKLGMSIVYVDNMGP